MTRQGSILIAVLVTLALATSTICLYQLKGRVDKLEEPPRVEFVRVVQADDLKAAWPEGWQMVKLGGLTLTEFMAEARSRIEAEAAAREAGR